MRLLCEAKHVLRKDINDRIEPQEKDMESLWRFQETHEDTPPPEALVDPTKPRKKSPQNLRRPATPSFCVAGAAG